MTLIPALELTGRCMIPIFRAAEINGQINSTVGKSLGMGINTRLINKNSACESAVKRQLKCVYAEVLTCCPKWAGRFCEAVLSGMACIKAMAFSELISSAFFKTAVLAACCTFASLNVVAALAMPVTSIESSL